MKGNDAGMRPQWAMAFVQETRMMIRFDMGSGEPIADGHEAERVWPAVTPALLSVAEAEAIARRDTRQPHPAVIAAAIRYARSAPTRR
jgi:hypothetical protein